MAISTLERTGIQKLVIAMFNAVPGGIYLGEFTGLYEGAANRSLSGLADILGQSPTFKALFPPFQTAAEFATAILTPHGLQNNQETIDFVTSRFGTTSKAQLALLVGVTIELNTSPNAALVNAKAILVNKAIVSEQFSVTSNSQANTLVALQAAISQVTAATSSIATQNAINAASGVPGVSIGLTTGADFISPTQTNSAFKSTAGNDTFIATTDQFLTTADNIDGGDGLDTINVLNSSATTVAPILRSLEVINITQTGTTGTFDFTSATGVTAINNLTGTNQALNLNNVALATVVGIAGAQTQNTVVGYAAASGSNDSATISTTDAAQTSGRTFSVVAVENLTIANTGTTTVGALVATDARSIVLNGTGSDTIGTNAASNFSALASFNASGFTGTLTVDFNTGTRSTVGMTYTGAVGVNNVTLSNTNTVFDSIVYNSANSSLISRLSTINNFNTSGDKLNLAAFALGADTTVGATTVAAAGDIAGFFTGTNRVLLNAGTGTVYVDSNKDGNFNAGSDLAVVITGANAGNFTVADLTLA